MNESEFIDRCYRYGHFWNPKYPDCQNVDHFDLSKLSLGTDKVARQAALSWQEQDANLDLLVMRHHGRETQFSDDKGNVGPATLALSEVKRCGLPDYPPLPGIQREVLHKVYQDDELDGTVNGECIDCIVSYQQWAEATGSGSWPIPGCDPERSNRAAEHSLRVAVDTSRASSHQKETLDRCLMNVENCSGEVGLAVRHIVNGNGNTEKDVAFQPISGGTIGFAYFPTPGTCNQTTKARIDSTYNADVQMLSLLYIHEWEGHSNGAPHTRGGIMNPSIMRVPISWKNDPSWGKYKKWFGGVPIEENDPTPDPDPDPTPVPGPGGIAIATYKLEDISPPGLVALGTERIRITIKTLK